MGVLVECPKCRMKHPTQRRICQTKNGKGCGASLNGGKRMYWIEYYFEGRRIRERIGTSYKLALATLAKRKAAIAEGRYLDKPQGTRLRFGALMDWYLGLPAIKAKRSYDRDCLSARHLKAFFKDRLVKDLKPSMVDKYKQERLATKNQT